MKVKKFFWDYLYFSRIERLGIVVLLLGCITALLAPRLYGHFFKSTNTVGSPPPMAVCLPMPKNEAKQADFEQKERRNENAQLFYFNPNTLEAGDWQALGLPERTIKGILNYRAKGGQFRKPDDLAKIYSLSEEDFERLRPYIRMEQEHEHAQAAQPVSEAHAPQYASFDPNTVSETMLHQMRLPEGTIKGWLNYLAKGGRFRKPDDVKKLYQLASADYDRIAPYIQVTGLPVAQAGFGVARSYEARMAQLEVNMTELADWVKLPGIGEGWAKRILAWREKLGGFARVEQIAETRMLPDSVFQKAKPFLLAEAQHCQKISLNAASWDDLNAHPYIEGKQARWIVAYREQHGKFAAVDDLMKITEIKGEWLEKVRPYLSI